MSPVPVSAVAAVACCARGVRPAPAACRSERSDRWYVPLFSLIFLMICCNARIICVANARR
ncbi:hypothetical protein EYF80_057124 [Liparis tanakae]|uniref:Uncharacterized protein n=1 Tax=Liparis tanakae TaxID=230148 RepID=A0A4Z2EVX9_9TELE|nr:hypothetical protein EYF80_057124 [Liparis tanakae]